VFQGEHVDVDACRSKRVARTRLERAQKVKENKKLKKGRAK
jgi:hypothetical protein